MAVLFKEPALKMANVLGFKLEENIIPEGIMNLVNLRESFRKNKDWISADNIKKQIIKLGYEIRDERNKTLVIRS